MFLNIKIHFKYILNNLNFFFLNNFFNKSKNVNILISSDLLIYLTTHLKLSSLFYTTHLVDIFSYDTPLTNYNNFLKNNLFMTKNYSIMTVYNFQSLHTQDRYYLFVLNNFNTNKSKYLSYYNNVNSIAEMFPAANWLEREVHELNGINFLGKKDLRNLMLQYGDMSFPFQKSFPTIGLKEMYYEPIKDTLIQNPVSIQL